MPSVASRFVSAPMKIGISYSTRPHWPKMEWVHRAFEANGHEVRRITGSPSLAEVDAWADVCLFEQRDCGIGWKPLRSRYPKRRSRWVWWWFDLVVQDTRYHVSDQNAYRALRDAWPLFDVVFVKEASRINEYREMGVAAEYLDQACWSGITAIGHAENPEFDVTIFGSSTDRYRDRSKDANFLVDQGLRVAWATNGSVSNKAIKQTCWINSADLPAFMSSGAVTLSIDIRKVPGYRSDRYWLAKGAGAVVLSRWEDYSDHGQLLKSLQSLIGEENHHKRVEIGKRNREMVMKEHTYEVRTQQLLRKTIERVDYGREGEVPDLSGQEDGQGE